MVDDERLTRLASAVLADVARLRRLAGTDDLASHDDQLDAVKYRFVTALEGCVGIAHHIVAAEGWEAPDTNADAIRSLSQRDVITAELANAMAKASGFRNLLVHRYGDIDDDAVVGFLDELDDVEQFVQQVLIWLGTQQSRDDKQ